VQKYCQKVQTCEYGARSIQTSDRRNFDDVTRT